MGYSLMENQELIEKTADIWGFDDPLNPLFNKPVASKENERLDNDRQLNEK